uniref:Selenoprotein P N-terminal domain-containing protein n=1 Tax=Anopheles atroparvus TaxID=41427 RepID=A0AAG5CRV3_ANOAO
MLRCCWCWLPLLVLLGGSLGAAQEMMISEELETCSMLDRAIVEKAFSDAADDFLGKVTVLFNVAPPKPVQTPRVFADRDPIHYNKIDYREQINLYNNLYRMFRSQELYRNGVRFLLSASLHRVPYEPVEYNFTDFFRSVQALAGEHNFTVYPNRLTANRTFALFGLREFQVYVIDRCSRVSYIIQPPWSLLQYAYVKAAVLSTFYDRPCGKCELENFLNSTVLDDEKHSEAVGAGSANGTKPYEDASDEFTPTGGEEDNEGEGSFSEEEDNENDSGGERSGSSKDDVDPFANLTVTGPELVLPLRVILPVLHIHVRAESQDNDTDRANPSQPHQLHHYIVLHSNDSDRHHHQHNLAQQNDMKLEELSLALNTMSEHPAEESDSDSNHIRVEGTDWPADQLREILNTSSVLYDPVQQRVFERLRRYNLTERAQYDEVSEISLANRFAACRRRQPPKAEQPRHNRRAQIKKHYARLIPWLNWTFGKAIPPPNAGRLRTSRRLH